MNSNKVLQDTIEELIGFVKDGSINPDEIKNLTLTMRWNKILSIHPYSIWQNASGMWCTHIKESGSKKIRRRKTKEELLDYLVDYYKKQEEKVYICDVFKEWSDRKLRHGEISRQSYDKYCAEFRRFFKKDSDICKKQMCNITEVDLEDFIKSTIKEQNLTRKAYASLSLLISGIYKHAKKIGQTEISITYFLGDLELPKSIFRQQFKDKKLEVFSEDEMEIVIDYLRNHVDIWNYGLLLQFETGMRIGELSAIKPEDVYENYILVQRTERKYRNDGKWVVDVQDYPKTFAGFREVYISPSAKKTIKQVKLLNPFGEYLFMNGNKRIRGNTFNKRLADICKKLGIARRSTHKIRKTYGTTLIDKGVDDSIIAEQMGHEDISTTKQYYYYSNKTRSNKIKQISEAINY